MTPRTKKRARLCVAREGKWRTAACRTRSQTPTSSRRADPSMPHKEPGGIIGETGGHQCATQGARRQHCRDGLTTSCRPRSQTLTSSRRACATFLHKRCRRRPLWPQGDGYDVRRPPARTAAGGVENEANRAANACRNARGRPSLPVNISKMDAHLDGLLLATNCINSVALDHPVTSTPARQVQRSARSALQGDRKLLV